MKKEESKNKNDDFLLEQITRSVLYEGYSLYPYHRSSVKNVKPVPFGAVYPKEYQNYNKDVHATTQTECVLRGSDETEVDIRVRFLHLRNKRLLKIDPEALGPGQFKPADSIESDGKIYVSGWEAVEREIEVAKCKIAEIIGDEIEAEITFDSEQANDIIYAEDGNVAGNALIEQAAIEGKITVAATPAKDHKDGYKLSVKITNTTPVEKPEKCGRDDVYGFSFLSTHTILTTKEGSFISQTDPDADWKKVIEACDNINTWPVLVDRDNKTVLSSPIILYDYPEIAPESMGEYFDGLEIEEALVLHVSTLSEEDKKKIDETDGKMKAMLERVKNITPEELVNLHGGFKDIESFEGKPQNNNKA